MMLSAYTSKLLIAAVITMKIAALSLVMGMVMAVLLSAMEMSPFAPMRWFVAGFTSIFRGLPEMLVIFFIYFGSTPALFALTGHYVQLSPFWLGSVALALIFASYATQTLRGAFKAVPLGQFHAARAMGLSKFTTLTRIVFPQMVMHAIPGLSNQWLVLLKDTALVSLIGASELMRQAYVTATGTSDYFNWYLSAGAIYLAITLLSKRGITMIERKFHIHGHSGAAG
ncbi:ABC transporter permease subunit [Vibrio profundum]|uniref:ABC transporter permease subunit n=1 Tax=Vibrio profundum TaxID=2910247 RepID=UPI003D0DD1C2